MSLRKVGRELAHRATRAGQRGRVARAAELRDLVTAFAGRYPTREVVYRKRRVTAPVEAPRVEPKQEARPAPVLVVSAPVPVSLDQARPGTLPLQFAEFVLNHERPLETRNGVEFATAGMPRRS
jgi:hypothetical protein